MELADDISRTTSTAKPASTNSTTWFSDLKAKFSQFSPSEFLSNLGLGTRQQQQQSSRKNSTATNGSSTTLGDRTILNNSNLNSELSASENTLTRFEKRNGGFASSVRRSDEPRRKVIVTKSNDKRPVEEIFDGCSRIVLPSSVMLDNRQKSEPPDFGRSNRTIRRNVRLTGEQQHDDDECPASVFRPSEDDVANAEEIELSSIDGYGGQRFGTLNGLLRTGKHEPGVGHAFEPAAAGYPTWCDQCGDFISGLCESQSLRCKNCRYTCHVSCQPLVTLDCRSSSNSLKSGESASSTSDTPKEPLNAQKDAVADEETTSPATEVTEVVEEQIETSNFQSDLPETEKLLSLINEYNKESEGLNMTLEENGITFDGFVRVHMNFTRPINIIAGEKAPTLHEVLDLSNEPERDELDGRKTITSFYLPRNTVKVLHITSETTTSEMVVSLLKKFKVADNPRKFALYERDLEEGKTLLAVLRRISDDACPLRLLLSWGPQSMKRFVLQENETGDIIWDAFRTPELQTFLKIMEIEETRYIRQIEQRYRTYRYWLENEIRHRQTRRARQLANRLAAEDAAVSTKSSANTEADGNGTAGDTIDANVGVALESAS